MRCPPNVHPQPALLHPDARGSRSAVRRACGAGGRVAVGGPRGPWAPAGPGWRAERAARRPRRPGHGAGTRGASEGSCRVTFPRERGRSSPPEASLPFVCFPAGGWRAAGCPAAHHARRGPRLSAAPPGVPTRTPRPVLAGVALLPLPPPGRFGARPPRSRAPRRGGPPPVLAAPAEDSSLKICIWEIVTLYGIPCAGAAIEKSGYTPGRSATAAGLIRLGPEMSVRPERAHHE
eukprot:XP_028342569.1 collagen alpha-2(I) chain-like [Physeter catodon]